MLAVEDMHTPSRRELPVLLTFRDGQIDVESLQPGHTIAVLYPERSFCLGEHVVMRVRDPAKIKVFPCDLDTLLQINEVIRDRHPLATTCIVQIMRRGSRDTLSLLRCTGCFGIPCCGKQRGFRTVVPEHRVGRSPLRLLKKILYRIFFFASSN
ncbi:uncharacterized protein EV420DRAFT_1501626 [Desarmillaria tabescens]|uniref:Uncharacterized protein n=1 Tax=Armillaria tabescens TaxID=1929756 RepID=A0AA39NLI6_ARMTA|nr:uncharacterized protein EV420DRAFT_1501626 [Desarmillaria tabescens]KAK0467860.1 hypothetical protein EV420DRAFT_1501626 [Desarmillaria tabescens]